MGRPETSQARRETLATPPKAHPEPAGGEPETPGMLIAPLKSDKPSPAQIAEFEFEIPTPTSPQSRVGLFKNTYRLETS